MSSLVYPGGQACPEFKLEINPDTRYIKAGYQLDGVVSKENIRSFLK